MFANPTAIQGQNCITLRRCSSGPQVLTSMANQGRTTEHAVSEFNLRVVDEILLEAVTGSVPGNRSDIDQLVHRKRTQNDFKVLLVQDTSRFTRAGQGHGQKLLYDLRSVGILVYFVAEDLLIDNEMAEMYVSFLFSAARQAVKQGAYASTSGGTNSFLAGRSPHARRAPMALDRMYSDGGVDRHIIRNMPDGTQQQLSLTGDLVRTFARNEKRGVPNHYIKQKNEQVRLVPGDPKHIATVHLIFYLSLVLGLSYRRIAMQLNDADVPSPHGKGWHTATIRTILLNPIYIGLSIRGRAQKGIYYICAEGQPQPSGVTLEELANNNTVKMKLRPRTDWLEREQPHLEDFLPDSVRDLATQRIEQHLDSIADAKPKKPNRDSHRNSSFLLKGILRSKQGNHLMTGRVGGKKGSGVRSYAVARGHNVPRSNNILTRRILAQPLEDAVLSVVREVIGSLPDLKGALKTLIDQNSHQMSKDIEIPEQLAKDIQRKQKQLALLSDDVDLEEDDVLSTKVATIKSQIRALRDRQRNAAPATRCQPLSSDAIAAEIAKDIRDYSKHLDERDNPHTIRLLGLLISSMVVDLETKEVELELSFPSWLGNFVQHRGPVGLDELIAYKPLIEAHPQNGRILGIYLCHKHGSPVCYTCKRRLAA